jgi:hypothetical protein
MPKKMEVYKELEKLGFFEWLDEIHKLKDVGVDIEYLDGLALNDIHKTVLNSLTFRWFREKYDWQATIEATSDQHSRKLGYNYWLWNHKTGEEHHTMPNNRPSGDWIFETYEEAELGCIIKLIEIVKQ